VEASHILDRLLLHGPRSRWRRILTRVLGGMQDSSITLLAASCLLFAYPVRVLAVPTVTAGVATGNIRLDGALDEPEWQGAGLISDLVQQDPQPGASTPFSTEVRVLIDSDTVIIGVVCQDPDPANIAIHTMQRDGEMSGDDSVALTLDPMNDGRRGYYFQINAANARRDGLVSGAKDLSTDWDGIWDAATQLTASGWTAEIRIPAQTLRFRWGQDQWGMNVQRYVPRVQTTLRWSGISLDARFIDLQRAGKLNGAADLRQGHGISFSPYGLIDGNKNYDNGTTGSNLEAGGDLTWNFSGDLSGYLTVNPDFAETEVDTRQANLSRFPVFFPEKRPFFLEGSEIFDFGPGLDESFIPFFSRRIGLFEGEKVSLPAGLKLLGHTGPWQIAGLAVAAEETTQTEQTNLLAGRVSYDVSEELTLGAIATDGDPEGIRDNTLVGVDVLWRTSKFRRDKNLSIGGWTAASYSDRPGNDNMGWGVSAEYPNDLWEMSATVKQFGADLDPALGFLPRPGTRWYQGGVTYKPRPQSESLAWARQFFFELYPSYIEDADGEVQSWRIWASPFNVLTQSGEHLEFSFKPQFERLDEPFEIADGVVIPAGDYYFTQYRVQVESASYRTWQIGSGIRHGEFYDGNLTEVDAFARYTTPGGHLQMELKLEHHQGRLDGGNFNIDIGQLMAVYAFTADVILSSNIQYDSESRDLGANTRLRWTIRPGADLFIVWNRGWKEPFTPEDPLGLRTVSDQLVAKLRWTFRM
jgi:hypothetical protein